MKKWFIWAGLFLSITISTSLLVLKGIDGTSNNHWESIDTSTTTNQTWKHSSLTLLEPIPFDLKTRSGETTITSNIKVAGISVKGTKSATIFIVTATVFIMMVGLRIYSRKRKSSL